MIEVHVMGAGILGPGLNGWEASIQILAGKKTYAPQDIPPIKPAILSANERRRCGIAVRLSIQAAQEAVERSGLQFEDAATVFATSEGSAESVHEICESLTSPKGVVSPTHFHNSVHNAAAGYWAIAAKCHEASNTLTCYDGSFGAGLLEAAVQSVAEDRAILLVAYDARLPQPLYAKRPFPADFACALMLVPPRRSPHNDGEMTLSLRFRPDAERVPVTSLANHALEQLRIGNPAARALPLLVALAARQEQVVVLEAPSGRLQVEVEPC